MTSPIPVTLIGATGLTGSATLHSLLSSSVTPFTITTIARKAIEPTPASNSSTTFSHTIVSDLFDVPKLNTVAEKDGVYVSCLGTTRAGAGGLEQQEKLDLGLNTDLAKKAKADGASNLILVSSAGTDASSRMPYSRMKGTLENNVKAMEFKSCVILRPAMLLGGRNESRPAEYVAQKLFRGFRSVGLPMGSLCVDAEDVGDCIAHYASNPPKEAITVVDNHQITQTAKAWREVNASK